MQSIPKQRLTADVEGDFVIFLIGMRINHLWKVHKWLPVFLSMVPMIRELYAHPETGFMGALTHFGPRNIWQLHYWRSYEQLVDYAHSPEHHHLPGWRAFNRTTRDNADVGIWHETYVVRAGEYETVYVNTPPFGLGAAAPLLPVTGRLNSSRGRMGMRHHDASPAEVTVDLQQV